MRRRKYQCKGMHFRVKVKTQEDKWNNYFLEYFLDNYNKLHSHYMNWNFHYNYNLNGLVFIGFDVWL